MEARANQPHEEEKDFESSQSFLYPLGASVTDVSPLPVRRKQVNLQVDGIEEEEEGRGAEESKTD